MQVAVAFSQTRISKSKTFDLTRCFCPAFQLSDVRSSRFSLTSIKVFTNRTWPLGNKPLVEVINLLAVISNLLPCDLGGIIPIRRSFQLLNSVLLHLRMRQPHYLGKSLFDAAQAVINSCRLSVQSFPHQFDLIHQVPFFFCYLERRNEKVSLENSEIYVLQGFQGCGLSGEQHLKVASQVLRPTNPTNFSSTQDLISASLAPYKDTYSNVVHGQGTVSLLNVQILEFHFQRYLLDLSYCAQDKFEIFQGTRGRFQIVRQSLESIFIYSLVHSSVAKNSLG